MSLHKHGEREKYIMFNEIHLNTIRIENLTNNNIPKEWTDIIDVKTNIEELINNIKPHVYIGGNVLNNIENQIHKIIFNESVRGAALKESLYKGEEEVDIYLQSIRDTVVRKKAAARMVSNKAEINNEYNSFMDDEYHCDYCHPGIACSGNCKYEFYSSVLKQYIDDVMNDERYELIPSELSNRLHNIRLSISEYGQAALIYAKLFIEKHNAAVPAAKAARAV